MAYRYEKGKIGNIFKKELPISDALKRRLYARRLTVEDYLYIKDKVKDSEVPIDCIVEEQLKVVRKFGGIEKVRDFDWKFLESQEEAMQTLLNEVSSDSQNPMAELYEKLKFKLKLYQYSDGMRDYFKDMFFEAIDEDDRDGFLKNEFNYGSSSMTTMISRWDLFKDKDISYCLSQDRYNTSNVSQEQLREFMEKHSIMAEIAIELGVFSELSEKVISQILKQDKQAEIEEYLRNLAKTALEKEGINKQGFYGRHISFTDEQRKELLKYVPFEEILRSSAEDFTQSAIEKIIEEAKTLPSDYIENMPFSLSKFKEYGVVRFIELYGLKNVIDFDRECGNFFSKNGGEMLSLMYTMYLNYAGNDHNPETSFYTKQDYNRDYYTKDEFYEAMRRMIVQGPNNWDYASKAPNYRDMVGEFRERNRDLFISENAPAGLQELFYTKNLTPAVIAEHPEYLPYLKGYDVEMCFQYRYVQVYDDSKAQDYYYNYESLNLYKFLVDNYGFEEAMKFVAERSDLLDIIFKARWHEKYVEGSKIKKGMSLDEIATCFDRLFEDLMSKVELKYPKKIPESTIKNCPKMFLPKDADPKLQELFYNRELDPSELVNNSEYMKQIKKTDIAYGLGKQFFFLIGMFPDEDVAVSNERKLKVLRAYDKIKDPILQERFIEFLKKNAQDIDEPKYDVAAELLTRLSNSNASEIFSFRDRLAVELLAMDNPLKGLEQIENVFLRRDLPTTGKLFSVFQLLYPNFDKLDETRYPRLSPTLQHFKAPKLKKLIIFSDLMRIALASNNRSLKEYLEFLEEANEIYLQVKNNPEALSALSPEDKEKIERFRDCLVAVIEEINTEKRGTFDKSENALEDILKIEKKLSKKPGETLADKLVALFGSVAGIHSVKEAKEFSAMSIARAEERNRQTAESNLVIQKGDLVKGFGKAFLGQILQNGSVAKEFLGSSAGSDATPLDTDLSMITADVSSVEDAINATAAKDYGSVYIVLKNPDYNLTRDSDGNVSSTFADVSRPELFYTGVCDTEKSRHYGVRTGFSSTEISASVAKEYDETIGLEIAMNGFYIPVVNMQGEVVFTPQDYENLRKKMCGLSRYGIEEFEISENLYTPEVMQIAKQIDESDRMTAHKRSIINRVIAEAIEELGLKLKTEIDGDLTPGFVELIDTGSTGRGTNKPGDGDFDFMMRLDKSFWANPEKLQQLSSKIKEKLSTAQEKSVTGSGDIRYKGVELEDIVVDIDITFTERCAEVTYSTDMSLAERIEQIKKQYPEKYRYVISNVLLAKQILKKAGAYKPNRGETPQGGLGGVGIENWVLQHGGSFYDAAMDFLRASQGKSFEEFKASYAVWDFGENHLSMRRGHYAHDNFITGNMSEEGFLKMRTALAEYIKSLEKNSVKANENPPETNKE